MRLGYLVFLPFLCPTALALAQTNDAAAPAPDKSSDTLFNPVPDNLLRSLNTDRPTKSNSPVTVDAGHFQIESDLFNDTHSNAGGVTTRLYTAFDPVLKLGVTNNIDLEVQFTGYNWLETAVPGAGTYRQSGVGDLYLRAKVNLFGNEGGPALALIPYVKLPAAAQGIGNGHTEGGVIAPFTYPLPLDFTLLIMPEIDVLKNYADAGHHFSYTQLINISHPIGPHVTIYGEFYSALGTDARTPPVYTLDTALAWSVTDTLQLDVGANVGLNRAAPNLQLYAGISKRF
jgi:hypothetical protein